MKYLYRLYQLVDMSCQSLLVASVLTSLSTVLGCMLGNGHFWGYYPGKYVVACFGSASSCCL